VRSGDIWVNGNDAYMYFTNEEIAEGVRINISTTNGGWKKADYWNLRSMGNGGSYSTENALMRVDPTGTVILNVSNLSAYANGRLLCPEFTV